MKIRNIAAISAVVALSISLSIPAGAADQVEEQWFLPTSGATGGLELQSFTIQENLQIAENTSVLGAIMDQAGTQSLVRYCKTVSDEFCSAAFSMFFDAILPKCESDLDTNCIAGLSAVSSSGEEKIATYVRNFPQAGYTDFPAASARNLPQGSTPSLWKIPGLTNGGGTDEYLINFTLRGGVGNNQDKFNFSSYSSFISPVTVKTGNYGRFEKKDARGKDQCRFHLRHQPRRSCRARSQPACWCSLTRSSRRI